MEGCREDNLSRANLTGLNLWLQPYTPGPAKRSDVAAARPAQCARAWGALKTPESGDGQHAIRAGEHSEGQGRGDVEPQSVTALAGNINGRSCNTADSQSGYNSRVNQNTRAALWVDNEHWESLGTHAASTSHEHSYLVPFIMHLMTPYSNTWKLEN